MSRSAHARHMGLVLATVGIVVAATLALPLFVAMASDPPVVFPDANLDVAVRAAIGFQPGRPIYPSDLTTLTSLVATGDGIADVTGLEYATSLTSLDLSGNSITTVTPLAGLTNLTSLDVSGNGLDLTPGSAAMSVIATLEGVGARVSYRPQRAGVSQPALSSSAPKYGTPVTFSVSLAPLGAAGA
jgi:hypothetical protein